MPETGTTPLAQHLDRIYTQWRANRKPLEDKWLSNWQAFRNVVTETWKANEGRGYRSDSNLNVTRQKIMSAFSLIIMQVIRGGHIVHSIKPDETDETDEALYGPDAEQAKEQAAQELKALIDDELADCDAERAYARNILACAVYGETYAKESIHVSERTKYRPDVPEGITDLRGIDPGQLAWRSYVDRKTGFGWLAVSPFEIVRDLENDDMQRNAGAFHERMVSPYELRKNLGKGGFWFDAEIKAVLEQAASHRDSTPGTARGETDASLTPGQRALGHRGASIRWREFNGRAPRQLVADFLAYQQAPEGEKVAIASSDPNPSDNGDEVEVFCVMCDDHVVALTEREPGRRPFERAVWEDALDDTGGQGMADSVADVQKALTGSLRAYEDGAKAASALILVLREGLVDNPEDIARGIKQGFATIKLRSSQVGTMADAVQQLKIENPANAVQGLIELLLRFVDDESLLPRISQGLSTSEDTTAYEMSIRNERSGSYTGAIIRNLDEHLCEPMIERLIRRHMEDPDWMGPRGNFHVKAQGFSGYEQRVMKVTAIYQLLALAAQDPDIKAKLKLDDPLREIAASLDWSFDSVWRSDEEMEQREARIRAMAMQEQQDAESLDAARAEKERATAVKTLAEAEAIPERLTMERAKTVKTLREPPKQPPAPPNVAAMRKT